MALSQAKSRNFSDHNIEKRAGTDKDAKEGKDIIDNSSLKTVSKPKNEQNMKQSLLAS
jgi:hypothetical protein